MKKYQREQEKQAKISRVAGVTLALCILLISYLILELRGLTYLSPPPPDESPITMEFNEIEEEEVKPKQHWKGTQPTAEKVDPTKETELVKHAKAPVKGTKQNLAQATTVDNFGDVNTPEPEREEPIIKKALFTSANNVTNKDTLAQQTSSEATDKLEPGHPLGNTEKSITIGAPNAKLEGRTVNGKLPSPSYNVTESGKVVVKIKVNREGKVVEAQPGEAGTNLTNKTAWEAAKKAALEAQFNPKADALEFQYGTITYIFNIIK